MDRVRNRIGIRQSLADASPITEESRQRLEELNRRMKSHSQIDTQTCECGFNPPSKTDERFH